MGHEIFRKKNLKFKMLNKHKKGFSFSLQQLNEIAKKKRLHCIVSGFYRLQMCSNFVYQVGKSKLLIRKNNPKGFQKKV